MSVNGIQGYSQVNAYNAYAQTASQTSQAAITGEGNTANESYFDSAAATVEFSSEGAQAAENASSAKKGQNIDLVNQLQAQTDAVKQKLMDYVHESLMSQADMAANADEGIWRFLAKGNYTVSAAAKEEAQKAISEGGYFSVEETANRLLEFAKALAGDDPEQAEKMRSAVQKGFKEAEKVWGGKLPEISSKTYDAVMKKFDDWANEGKVDQTTPTI